MHRKSIENRENLITPPHRKPIDAYFTGTRYASVDSGNRFSIPAAALKLIEKDPENVVDGKIVLYILDFEEQGIGIFPKSVYDDIYEQLDRESQAAFLRDQQITSVDKSGRVSISSRVGQYAIKGLKYVKLVGNGDVLFVEPVDGKPGKRTKS